MFRKTMSRLGGEPGIRGGRRRGRAGAADNININAVVSGRKSTDDLNGPP
jgi:hypothetical protein